MLGREGRDEENATVERLLRNMGRIDIAIGIGIYSLGLDGEPVGVIHTADSVPLRGDSRTTAYCHEQSERAPDYPVDISEDELWPNLEYFLGDGCERRRRLSLTEARR
ncbi:hypothetical protein [Halogranum rubrum]|uniref:Mannonate dehydratase n=1 Tax=Halogranum salarium B-1 TaxID=1210908 RepID=J2ZAR1_9EURY|nr:hypothetical protein [Halogranum salarium]EJN57735.1 Mannonate dehydratase [Halogranum salarium B-1]